MPVVIHRGFTDEEIVGLADEDNENDEYHEPVFLVDTWMSYKALVNAGWTQERIAKAKGHKDHSLVSRRLSYASFPDDVLYIFVKNDFLKESHAGEIDKLCNFHNLTPWLDRESILRIVQKENLSESHIAELCKCSKLEHLEPWLTRPHTPAGGNLIKNTNFGNFDNIPHTRAGGNYEK